MGGILKQRFSDFVVNEIGLDGEVVHLKTPLVATAKPKEVCNLYKRSFHVTGIVFPVLFSHKELAGP